MKPELTTAPSAPRATPRRSHLLLAFVALASMSACGGNEADGSSPAAPAPAPAPAPAARSCQSLGEVGRWEKIDPAGLGAHSLATDPHHPGVVYMGADYDDGMFEDARGVGVYKSTDCGASFQKVSTGRNSTRLDTGRLWTLMVHPGKPDTLYTTPGYGALGWWRSVDGGVNWDEITPKVGVNLVAGSPDPRTGFLSGMTFDPQDPDHQFLTYHDSCSPVWGQWGCLAETRNGGDTWKVLTRENPNFAMEVRAYPLGGDRFLVNQDLPPDAQGHRGSEMHLTEDGGRSFTKVHDVGYGGHDWVQAYRAANGDSYIGDYRGLQAFSSDGRRWRTVAGVGTNVLNVVGDGKTMFVHARGGVWRAAESNPDAWTRLVNNVPTPDPERACWLSLDRTHKLLYASCWFDVYRMRYAD